MKDEILALMADNHPRTSYEISALLYGPQRDARRWFRVALACDRLVAMGRLAALGKLEHRTVYQSNIRKSDLA